MAARVTPSPYAPGVELRIRRHVPPQPFGNGYGPCPRPGVLTSEDEEAPDRVAFALDNPPIETLPPDEKEQEKTFTITGTKTLRRFGVDGGGAHVVTGYAGRDKATVYVAKIYDGVYYPLQDEDAEWDCMLLADHDYAVESWAYETMQAVENVGTKLVPRCFEGWTFPLKTNRPGRRRWVRMLLLELVQGETMLAKIVKATKGDALQYSLLPPEDFRLRVLRNLMEAEISIWWDAEVLHSDQEPRNVIVRNDGSVKFIDFNKAVVFRFVTYRKHPKYREGGPRLPPSPIERYWPFNPRGTNLADPAECYNPWADWIPQSWLQNKELAAKWLLETFQDKSPSKYRPLSDRFLNHPAHAQRSSNVQATLERLGRKPGKDKE